MGWGRKKPTAAVAAPAFALIPLQEWLLKRANIPAARLPALLQLLDQHWITDVNALLKSVSALEKHLPAAAFQAIQHAALTEPTAADALASENLWRSADTASVSDDNNNGTAAAALYSSPMKFTGDGFGFADGSPDSARMRRTPRSVFPAAAAAAGAGALPSAPLPGSPKALLQSQAELRAAKAKAFQAEAETYRRQLRARGRRALSPDCLLARLWEEGLLVCAVALVLLAMPIELAFVEPGGGAALYDTLWFANRAVEVVFSADVAFRTCLAYREPAHLGGRWVFSRRRIFLRYLRTWLLVDLLAATPVELGLWGVRRLFLGSYFSGETSTYERLLRLTRLLKLLRPGHVYIWLSPPRARTDHAIGSKPMVTSQARAAIKLIGGALLLSHWLASVWVYAGMRSAAPILSAPLPAVSYPSPPPHLAYPSPPNPPMPPAPMMPPADGSGDVTYMLSNCWLAKHGLLTPATPYTHAFIAPHPTVYVAAWHTALAMVFGVGGGAAATPAGWVEHGVASAMLILGAAIRLLGLAFACAVLCAAKPHDVAYRQTFSELRAFCAEKKLPPALSKRLRTFFRQTSRMEATTRYDVLLASLSPKLRAEAGRAMAPALLQAVPYLRLAPSSSSTPPLESAFLSSVVLALEPKLLCPREFLRSDRLTILERGVAAKRGRILTAGCCLGEDAIICRDDLKDLEPAIAIDYTQVVSISSEALFELTRPHEHASRALRAAAVCMALRRAFVAEARARVAASEWQHGRHEYALAPLLGACGMFDGAAQGLTGNMPTGGAHACSGSGSGGSSSSSSSSASGVDARVAAMCAAVEERLQSKLNALAAAVSSTSASGQWPPSSPEPRTAAARCSAAPEACGGSAANTPAMDNLAAAWPCTMASAGSRRRRSARSLDGTEIGGRRSHRASPGHRSAHHSHRGAPHSSRSVRHGAHHRSGFSQALLERIERLEGAAAASATGAPKLSADAAAPPPVSVPFAFPPRQGDGSQSPPLSAERRHAMIERGELWSGGAPSKNNPTLGTSSPGLEC